MGARGARLGGFLGGLIGFVTGGMIPARGDASMSFFSRVITGNVIVVDPDGFFISSLYAIIAVIVLGTLGYITGGLAEESLRK